MLEHAAREAGWSWKDVATVAPGGLNSPTGAEMRTTNMVMNLSREEICEIL